MVNLTETAEKILKERYYLEGESSWEEVTKRVASCFCTSDKEYRKFYNLLIDMDFLPNSPALMNAGTDIHFYSACTVLPIEDNIESIYKYVSDAAKISKAGAGVGANFSKLRAAGSPIGGGLGTSSGPLSFMKIQNESTEAIKQGGRRKGANIMLLDCEHEDILPFIKAKDEPGVLENANLSVIISDKFMQSLESNTSDQSSAYWSEKNVKLWDELIKRAHSSAEPGVIFGDTIERANNAPEFGRLEAVNPLTLQ